MSCNSKQKEKATFPGTCYLCGLPIYVDDEIQRWTVVNTPVAAHKHCVTELLSGGQSIEVHNDTEQSAGAVQKEK